MKKIISFILVFMMLFAYIPTLSSAASQTYSIAQVLDAAATATEYINANKKIPDTVKIGQDTVDTACYYALMLSAVVALSTEADTLAQIEVIACEAAPKPQEKFSGSETLDTEAYVTIAQNALTFVKNNNRAPNHSTTPKNNRISYQGVLYAFSRVLKFYNENERLPLTLTVESWKAFSGEDLKTTAPTATPTVAPTGKMYTVEQVVAASISLEREIRKNSALPETINVGGVDMNMGQYMNLAFRATVSINEGYNEDVMFVDASAAPAPADTTEMFVVPKDDYIEIAQKGITFIEKNGRVANYLTAVNGRIGYNNAVFAFAQILSFYGKNNVLPESINIVPWHIFIAQDADSEKDQAGSRIEFIQVKHLAERVVITIERNKKLPMSVMMDDMKLYMSELLSLFADTVLDVACENDSGFSVLNVLNITKGKENLKEGKLSRSEYLETAYCILAYMSDEGTAPEFMPCSLGSISFENLIYTYAEIIAYSSSDELVESITVRTWERITGEKLETASIEPQYTATPSFVPESNNTVSRARNEKTADLTSIALAAKRLVSSVKYSQKLPSRITVDGNTLELSDFLMLMLNTVLYIDGNLFVDVALINADNPEGDGENIKNGAVIGKEEYIKLAKEMLDYTKKTSLAPSYVQTSSGAMGYKTSLYFFAKTVEQFEDYNYVLPDSVTVETWESLTGMVLPTPMVTLSPMPTPVPTPYNGIGVMEGDLYGTGGVGQNGGVASSSKYASKIGVDILKAGGNAIDAAVATIFAVGLCEPSGSSIGGDGITVIYLADEDKYITYDYMTAGTGSGPVGVPGIVLGASQMLEKYGTMTLQQVLAPVIKLAREGFAVTNTFCKKSRLVGDKEGTYLNSLMRNDGEYFQEGDIFKNEDLANVLQAISDNGVEYFYDSEFTDELCAYLQSQGCTITREDFAAYEAFEGEPRIGEYRGYTIYGGSGSATGSASVINMLAKMDNYDLALLGHDHSETVRITATSFGIRPSSSMNEKLVLSLDELTEDVDWFDTKSTTMLVTRDKYGNMVSSNNTLGANFGSAIAMPGTGFCMSSHNCAVGKRVGSTMSPCIVAHEDGTPMLGVGSPGNSAIITATAITISNMLDFDMTVVQAIHAPRLYGSGSTITIEARYSPWVIDDLKEMGFTLYAEDEFSDGVGCVSAIYVDKDGTVYTAADIRREYMSYAY